MTGVLEAIHNGPGFEPHWDNTAWSSLPGWLEIGARTGLGVALLTCAVIAGYVASRWGDRSIRRLLIFLAAFLLLCSIGQVVDSLLFWQPWFALATAIHLAVAISSLAWVTALVITLMRLKSLPGTTRWSRQLQAEIDERQQVEDRFKAFIDWAPLAIIMTDSAGRIVLANRQAESVFGYRREALIDQPIEMLMAEDQRERHRKLRADYLRDPTTRQMAAARELYGLRSDGSQVPIEIRLNPIHTTDGLFIFSAIADATQRKLAASLAIRAEVEGRTAELLRQKMALERTNVALEQFAYIASHDLQEPIRKMSSFSGLLQQKYQGRLDDDADRYLHYIIDAARRMKMLISDLLSFSRAERKALKLKPADLNEVVDVAIENLDVTIQENGAHVTRDLLPTVVADAEQLVQVFQNLIGNAIKFHRAEVPPVVHVGVEADGSDWLISVRDNGIGIEREYWEQIFVIFKRLHSQAEYPGSGIGLAISKKIVDRHGGALTVASEPGQGTVFTVRISHTGAQTHELTDVPVGAESG